MPAIEGAQRPFWMHQIVEYLIGIVLVGAAFQAPRPAVPAVMGILVIANAAIARGPASAYPLVGRKVHRWLDVVVMVLLVAAALQPAVDTDSSGRLMLFGIAFVMFFIWLNSDFTHKADRKKTKQAPKAAPKTAPKADTAVQQAPTAETSASKARQSEPRPRSGSDEIGKKAGRAVGDGVNAAKRFGKKLKDQQD